MLGVPEKHLAHLLSHGLGGVQDKHYNMHSFLPEKLAALTKWAEYLTSLDEKFSNSPDIPKNPDWEEDCERWIQSRFRRKAVE